MDGEDRQARRDLRGQSDARCEDPAEPGEDLPEPLPLLPGFREIALRRMAAQRRRLVTELTAERQAARLSQTEVGGADGHLAVGGGPAGVGRGGRARLDAGALCGGGRPSDHLGAGELGPRSTARGGTGRWPGQQLTSSRHRQATHRQATRRPGARHRAPRARPETPARRPEPTRDPRPGAPNPPDPLAGRPATARGPAPPSGPARAGCHGDADVAGPLGVAGPGVRAPV